MEIGIYVSEWLVVHAKNGRILKMGVITVNSEIFARTLFSRNFACAKFRENKILAKWPNDSEESVIY